MNAGRTHVMRKSFTITDTRFSKKADPLGDWLADFVFDPRGFGYQKDDPGAVCDTRVIGDFEMILVLGGESRITVGSELLVCHTGDLVLIPPFTPHAIDTPSGNIHENYWMHFDVGPAHLQPQFLSAIRPLAGKCTFFGPYEEMKTIFAQLDEEIRKGKPGVRIVFQTALMLAVMLIFRELGEISADSARIPGVGSAAVSARREWVRLCTEHILGDLQAIHSMEKLASLLHISESSLQKAFSAEMGMPPHQFVQMARVRQAEKLMMTTAMTLEEIAAEVGLSSAHYLNMAFKRFYHMAPREWKKKMLFTGFCK